MSSGGSNPGPRRRPARPGRAAARRDRRRQRRRPRPGATGRGHRLRLRARPGHLPRVRPLQVPGWPPPVGWPRIEVRALVAARTEGRRWVSWAAAGQCAGAEPRAAARPVRRRETEHVRAGPAAGLSRGRARGRQDVAMLGGPPPGRPRHRRRDRPVETHGRAYTGRIGGLEVVPAADGRPRGLRRARWTSTRCWPGARVALVDELAHTNATRRPRIEKRWQDVEQLLDAGHRRDHHGEHPAPGIAE